MYVNLFLLYCYVLDGVGIVVLNEDWSEVVTVLEGPTWKRKPKKRRNCSLF